MFGKKPDLKKELNNLFAKEYSKMEDAILKPLQQKAYERLADNPNDIYLGKFDLATFRPDSVSYRSDIAVFNKKVPVIKLYINDKFEIDHDIVVQVITDYFGDGIDANGYSAENITVSLNGNDITVTANDVTFDNDGPIKDDSNVVLNHIIATGNQKYIDEIIKKDIFKEDSYLRANIASLGIDKYCQMLINDKSKVVRCAIISLGIKKYLDIYVNSDNTFDREEVAEVASTNNYTEYLDKLVYDSHCMVRKLVAESGNPKYFDILVNDEDAPVRANVARIAGLTNQVKYLDILSKDKSRDVRDAVLYYADDDY